MDQLTLRWINFTFELLQVLAILFALWLASGIALEQFVSGGRADSEEDFDDEEGFSGSGEVTHETEPTGWQPRFSRGLAVILWLVLSGLFYLPLSDLINGLRTAVFLGIGWQDMGLSPAFNSFGSLPQNYYFLWTLIVLVVVYASVLWIGRRAFSDRPGSLLTDLPLSSIERTFMLLGAAGLVYFVVNNLLTALTWVDLPNQTAQPQGGPLAFLAPALVGLLVLVILVIWMNSSLLREEILMDEETEFEAEGDEVELQAPETSVEAELASSLEAQPADTTDGAEFEQKEEEAADQETGSEAEDKS